MDTSDSGAKHLLTQRLQQMAGELKELEPLIRTGDIDARVLREFREAVDYIRTTAWAIQQWIELREHKQDPYSVLPMLTLERVHRATQIAHDLSLDLDSADVSFETPGLEGLYGSIKGLYSRLANLFHGDDTLHR